MFSESYCTFGKFRTSCEVCENMFDIILSQDKLFFKLFYFNAFYREGGKNARTHNYLEKSSQIAFASHMHLTSFNPKNMFYTVSPSFLDILTHR